MIVDDIFSYYFINFITIIINQIPIVTLDNNNGLLNSYNETLKISGYEISSL